MSSQEIGFIILNSFACLIFLMMMLYVVVSIKFKMENAAIVITLCYFATSVLRLCLAAIQYAYREDNANMIVSKVIYFLDMNATCLIYIGILFFVFELRTCYHKIRCDLVQEFLRL